jgi:hypothetical protein
VSDARPVGSGRFSCGGVGLGIPPLSGPTPPWSGGSFPCRSEHSHRSDSGEPWHVGKAERACRFFLRGPAHVCRFSSAGVASWLARGRQISARRPQEIVPSHGGLVSRHLGNGVQGIKRADPSALTCRAADKSRRRGLVIFDGVFVISPITSANRSERSPAGDGNGDVWRWFRRV